MKENFEIISALPQKKFVIGTREIVKATKEKKVKEIVLARNCPDFLIQRVKALETKVSLFEGNQKDLGTRLGKPFPVSMVGYE